MRYSYHPAEYIGICMSLSFVYLYVIQALYEFVFGKYGITCGFGIFKTLPRELVPIDDTLTLADVGVEGTVAIEECDECPAPLTYIDDSVVCQYCNTQVYL